MENEDGTIVTHSYANSLHGIIGYEDYVSISIEIESDDQNKQSCI